MEQTTRELFRHPIKTINDRKELRYLMSGGVSEVIEYVSFLILLAFAPRLLYVANSISFALGVLSGFLLHKTYSFRGEQQFKTHHQFVGYISLAAVNFILINILVGVLVNRFHLHPFIGKLIAIIITVSWTFVLSNSLIFRERDQSLNTD